MPVETGMYANFRPADIFGSYQRGVEAAQADKEHRAKLSELAYQRQRQEKADVQAEQDRKMAMAEKRMTIVGPELEGLAGLSEKERAAAWPTFKQKYVQAGVLDPSDSPDEYDPNHFKSAWGQYKNSNAYLARQEQLAKIAKMRAEAAKDSAPNATKSLSPGEKQVDETFGKELADYHYGGGKASVEKNIQRLEGAIGKLKENPDITGGFTTKLPWTGEDAQQDWINPEMAAVRDDIRGAIQGSLKQVLGAQFTEKEAQAMFNRAFNPRLSPEENVRRANAELEAIKRMAAQKDQSAQYFAKQGTLKGFKPSATRMNAGESETQLAKAEAPSSSGIVMNEANAAPPSIKPKAQRTSQDMEAIHWAKKNKSDPRAQQILQMHGEK